MVDHARNDSGTATENEPQLRARLVLNAIREWKNQLVDFGGRNPLLYFKDLKVGTLDLSRLDDPQIRNRLLKGSRVRLSDLFATDELRKDAAKRARTIRAKAIENDEERGIRTLFLAQGMVTWTSDRSYSQLQAPLLLYRLDMLPIGVASSDFTLEIDGEPEFNPTLLALIAMDFGLQIDPDPLLFANGDADAVSFEEVVSRISDMCATIPGFTVTDRLVIGNFSYAKLPMVRDLENAHEQIEEHDLLAAIAGVASARVALRDRHPLAGDTNGPVVPPPNNEFLVLDADSSQSRVIAAAVSGADLVVIGPPGTGKSQTISNLIATLIAHGKSVLFVAEKRAAIDAVLGRLKRVKLSDLILDLHDGASNRRKIAQELARTLSAASTAPLPDVYELHRQLSTRRAQLEQYTDALHEVVQPWGISAFDAQNRLLTLSRDAGTPVRIFGAALQSVTNDDMKRTAENLRQFVEQGGPRLIRDESPWSATYATKNAASPQRTSEIAQVLNVLTYEYLPALGAELQQACRLTGLSAPLTLETAEYFCRLLEDASQVTTTFTPDVYGLDLVTLEQQFGAAKSSLRFLYAWFSGLYRSARETLQKQVSDTVPNDETLLRTVSLAISVTNRWREYGSQARPSRAIPQPVVLRERLNQARDALNSFVQLTGLDIDLTAPLTAIQSRLDTLVKDQPMLLRLPELHRLENAVRDAQFERVLSHSVELIWPGERAAEAVEYVWLSSVLQHIHTERPVLAGFDSDAQTKAVDEFTLADERHVHNTNARILRIWAERAVQARNEYPDEAQIVRAQANRQRRHMPLHDMFEQAEHVLRAIKPCWVMSPLTVAQVLPSRPCFDVVVFDEASQIRPSDAVSALLRGHQAVVAGDPFQLPPTDFFSSNTDESQEAVDQLEDDDAFAAAVATGLTKDMDSILDVMRTLLPSPYGERSLGWHYRSKDERLITFSNAQPFLYDWSLTTFPGALAGDCLVHELVPFQPGRARVSASTPEEVDRVKQLIIEHARNYPGESLGVIALGSDHANAIAEAIRLATEAHPELAALQQEQLEEPLFIKNLERVQGDERDAIILTVGYGKTVDGRMRYNFGPLNREGGHRRLNVAITRARRRMTVVSSFAGEEMDPEKCRNNGVRMLRDYLIYAASHGTNLGLKTKTKPALNGFERDVYQHLTDKGLKLQPQFGASGYWIDFAVMHPGRPSEPILAIETDGASYHSSPSARDRDRLRQQHLENLGWSFHRIWSTEWFRAREHEIDRALESYQAAISKRDRVEVTPAKPAVLPSLAPVIMTNARTLPWPNITTGLAITEYSQDQLRKLLRWVESDGRLRTNDEIISEMSKALGYKRRGDRIVETLTEVIEAERKGRPGR